MKRAKRMVIIIIVINDLEPSLVSVNIQFCGQGLCCCLVPYIGGNWIGLNVMGTNCGERYFVLHLGLWYECILVVGFSHRKQQAVRSW